VRVTNVTGFLSRTRTESRYVTTQLASWRSHIGTSRGIGCNCPCVAVKPKTYAVRSSQDGVNSTPCSGLCASASTAASSSGGTVRNSIGASRHLSQDEVSRLLTASASPDHVHLHEPEASRGTLAKPLRLSIPARQRSTLPPRSEIHPWAHPRCRTQCRTPSSAPRRSGRRSGTIGLRCCSSIRKPNGPPRLRRSRKRSRKRSRAACPSCAGMHRPSAQSLGRCQRLVVSEPELHRAAAHHVRGGPQGAAAPQRGAADRQKRQGRRRTCQQVTVDQQPCATRFETGDILWKAG